jgi:hypothetical protein
MKSVMSLAKMERTSADYILHGCTLLVNLKQTLGLRNRLRRERSAEKIERLLTVDAGVTPMQLGYVFWSNLVRLSQL